MRHLWRRLSARLRPIAPYSIPRQDRIDNESYREILAGIIETTRRQGGEVEQVETQTTEAVNE